MHPDAFRDVMEREQTRFISNLDQAALTRVLVKPRTRANASNLRLVLTWVNLICSTILESNVSLYLACDDQK